MKKYYVNQNAQNNGDHEVHTEDCPYYDKIVNKLYLGEYSSCFGAVNRAKELGYSTANGCKTCSLACHTG